MKKDVVAILLAGGKGTRLKELTEDTPKPALHFGGNYRIIDFVLSNCTNSGIDTLGIITQFEPFELTSYIGNGSSWDLDKLSGGISFLPPYTTKEHLFSWQKGTAHAVFQHLKYLEIFSPQDVLILSTDHIYKMDYNDILRFHRENKADLTISTININPEEASRFGILKIDSTNRVIAFTEKPVEPESFIASQGIYVFKYELLKALLNQLNTIMLEMDFGMHIIPYMVKEHQVYAYQFSGYFQDIGTINSLWQANMDLIDNKERFFYDKSWPIYHNLTVTTPHYVDNNSLITNSFISEGCYIIGSTINHSIISHSCKIGKNSYIKDSVLMPNVVVGDNCRLEKVIVKAKAKIPQDTIIHSTEARLIGG